MNIQNASRLIMVFLLASSVVGCDQVIQATKPSFSPTISWRYERVDNLIDDDRYAVYVSIFHEHEQSLRGKYLVRAYGDVFGEGGQENSGWYGDNFDESEVQNFPPGKANAVNFFYYINDPKLVGNNLDPNDFKNAIDLSIVVKFIPAHSEIVKESESTFVIRHGDGKWRDPDKK